MVAWRKGVGLVMGSTEPRFERLVANEWRKHTFGDVVPPGITGGPDEAGKAMIAKSLGLGETEYRLNWVPLGGYVKMLGQDDSGPVAASNDPRAFTNKSVAARMLVISAGVLMNIVLAIVGFMLLFRVGFGVTPPVIGIVAQNGPADVAGLRAGDRVVSINGRYVYDFNGLATSIALSRDGEPVPFEIERDGQKRLIAVTPRKPKADSSEFVSVGVGPIATLAGHSGRGQKLDESLLNAKGEPDEQAFARLTNALTSAVRPHEVITKLNGKAVGAGDYLMLRKLVDGNTGQPIEITVRTAAGGERVTSVMPTVAGQFGGEDWSVGGLRPRPSVASVQGNGPVKKPAPDGPAEGQILPGDILLGATLAVAPFDHTSATPLTVFIEAVDRAGQEGKPLVVDLLRSGKEIKTAPMVPVAMKTNGQKKYRLGLGFMPDVGEMTIGTVAETSAAKKVGIEPGWKIISAGGKPVGNWLALGTVIGEAPSVAGGGKVIPLELALPDGTKREVQLTLTGPEAAAAALRAELPIDIDVATEIRKTDSLLTAAKWGLAATRDFVLQSYVTVLRMTQRSLSPTNLQGPLGIVHTGGLIAWSKPPDWILWFICMISANLAVVNFLPLPILDGGHFVLLCLEKARGKPLSERAMAAIQMTGLALIGCIFLFVTFNDLTRLLG
jgi:regulator of sigma E protease